MYKSTLALVIVLLLLWSASFTAHAAGETVPRPRVVIVFGDSLTAGSNMATQKPPQDKSRVWVNQVEERSKGRLKMINEGKGGRPTDSVKEFEAMLKKHDSCDLLVLALGTNDSRDVSGECVPRAVANLARMIFLARERYGSTLPILMVGPPNIRIESLGPTRPIGERRAANLRDLGAAYEKLAKERQAAYVGLYGIVPDSSLTFDGVHPDVSGNAAMAATLLPPILKNAGVED